MESFLCPSRDSNPVYPGMPTDDYWRVHANGDRTCSYCGSLHEEDFAKICDAYSKGEAGYRFARTDKAYKAYGNRPGVNNAGDGGIKFYFWHIEDQHPDAPARKAAYVAAAGVEAEKAGG